MKKAFRYRAYPTKEQEVLIQKTFGCCRFVYNYFLSKKNDLYKTEQQHLSFYDCNKLLTSLKNEFVWLKDVDKHSLQNSLRRLDKSFTNFYARGNKGFPKYKSKKEHYASYQTNFNNNNIKFLGSYKF